MLHVGVLSILSKYDQKKLKKKENKEVFDEQKGQLLIE